MLKHIITLLLFACASINVAAQEVQLQPNHPNHHVVVKGDTLWDISAKFLKDPWLWPKVWKMNREQIKNPHLIYPGDVVVLDLTSGEPQLRLLRETVTLEPGVRIEELEKEAVATIAPNIIEPFLSQPLVIENDELENAPTIVGAQENRVALSQGVRIYIDDIQEEQGRFWNVYRTGKVFIDPVTKETLGTEAIHLGTANITRYGAPATAEIAKANQEIFKGDKLVVAPEQLSRSFVPRAPDSDIQGQILSIYGSVNEAGRNAIVSINRGANDGMEPGHVLAIYREGSLVKNPAYSKSKEKNSETPTPEHIKLPNERVGLLMVFRTFDRISYGLIMQASEPVNALDIVQTP